ncbi:dockerin type I domain-containing protein [Candidatus Albibeggiatoa sp. nov. BB20]|uniref:dockerin type I domain-containing protein n=1 Tax=Candidatus Albibeggiatoa sp. nov. BB20 TaxID=3162723 RepID=UPI00336533DC
MNRFIQTISVLILVIGYAGKSVAIDRNAYFVGNSLTYRTRLESGLRPLAQERGHTLSGQKVSEDFMQILSGASLWWHWYQGDAANSYFNKDEFIPDMTTNHWDTLVLQPYDGKPWHWNESTLPENWYYWQDRPREEGDVPMCSNFIDLMVNQGISDSSLQVYIYSQWPKVLGAPNNPDFENFDYPTEWNRGYTDTSRFNNRSRDYYEYLLHEVRSETSDLLDNEILMIPMGDAIYELNERLRTSPLVNGSNTYDDITDVYGDGNHLSPGVMQYFKALVFFTVLYREDPRGLTTGNYGDINWYLSLYHPYFVEITLAWKTLLQEIAWQVTATHFYSGVRDTLTLGDANLDGVVNITDFNILTAAWGRTDIDPYETGIGWRYGDFDGDGEVNQADLDIYQANTDSDINASVHEPPKLLIPAGLSENEMLNKTVVYGEKYITTISAVSAQGYKLNYQLKHAPVNTKLDTYNHTITWEANLLGRFQFDIIIREENAENPQELILKASVNVEEHKLTDYGIESENLGNLSKEDIENLSDEAFQAFRKSDIARLPSEIFKSMTANQMSYITYSAISAISVEQFLNLSPSVLRGINAGSLGGFSPDVLAQFTTAHIKALDPAVVFSKLPSEDISKIVTHFDLTKISVNDINNLLPSNWFFDDKTGRLNAPSGIPLSVKTLDNHSAVNMPKLPKLDSGLALGGDADETPTILEAMNQALVQNDLGQFRFTQDADGIVKATDDSGLQFAFIPNKASFVQGDSNTATEIQLNQRELRIVTSEKQTLSLIPAPKDMTLLRNILPDGEIYMGDKGEVIFDYTNVKDNRKQGDDFEPDVMACEFNAFVETSSNDDCHSYDDYDLYACEEDDTLGVQITRRTGRISRAEKYQSPEGKIVYADSTAQTIYPTIIEPTIFLTMLHQVAGLEDTEVYENGSYLVKFEGNDYILQADFTATASKLPIKGQLIPPTIQFQKGGFLEYTVVSNDIEYTQKLFVYPVLRQ